MTDALLARITAPAPEEVRSRYVAPQWPAGLAPTVVQLDNRPDAVLPECDVVVCVWTDAEAQATADVLTPGLERSDWLTYAKDFDAYKSQLTYRSPARDEKALCHYALITIGTQRVVVLQSALHVCTDAASIPLRTFYAQAIKETACSLWIDSGTSGGIGPDVAVGDTVAAENLRFDCTSFLKDQPFAHEAFPCTYDLSSIDFSEAEALMAVNAGLVAPQTERPLKVWHGDVLTCDAFLFDAVGDPFALETYDLPRTALCEEMDCSVLGLTAQDLGSAMPKFTSLRSVSDPQMPKGPSIKSEENAASKIYVADGYGAQAATCDAIWQVIASL